MWHPWLNSQAATTRRLLCIWSGQAAPDLLYCLAPLSWLTKLVCKPAQLRVPRGNVCWSDQRCACPADYFYGEENEPTSLAAQTANPSALGLIAFGYTTALLQVRCCHALHALSGLPSLAGAMQHLVNTAFACLLLGTCSLRCMASPVRAAQSHVLLLAVVLAGPCESYSLFEGPTALAVPMRCSRVAGGC